MKIDHSGGMSISRNASVQTGHATPPSSLIRRFLKNVTELLRALANVTSCFFPSLDDLTGFLRSPRWKTPVMSFLDEHCTVFDNEDENKLEFTTIHNGFKKLVESLLMELMNELGVTEEQFYESCDKASENPIHKKIVD